MSDEKEINKLLDENLNKLTPQEVDMISKNIISRNEWFNNIEYATSNFEKNKIQSNNNLFEDLEIFISYNHDVNDTVYKEINHTRTKLGDHYYQQLLSNPTKDTTILLNRQQKIKSLLENPEKHQKIMKLLEQLNQYQNDGLWIWKEQSQEFKQILQMLYFTNPYLQTFNTSEWFLKIYNYFQIIFIPLYGLLGPVIFFVLPYIIVRFIFGIKIPITLYYTLIKQTIFGGSISSMLFGKSKMVTLMQYMYQALTVFLYGYSIYNSFKAASTLNKIINMIHEKVNNLSRFIKTSYELYQEVKTIWQLEPLTVSYLELWDNLFEKTPYLLSDKGKILRTFYIINNGKDKLIPLLQITGFIDTINSITSLYMNSPKAYSFPVYLTDKSEPLLKCSESWNPFLNPSKAVKNDFQMGDDKPNNILITGPNASGKSTFIKSVVLGVLMAQTISIAPSTEMQLTPFKLLNTYLNIPDAKGRESLFEAEMYRARDHINMVYKLSPSEHEFSLVVMDEIFNSTNYEEGVAGAYIIGKELGKIKNSLTLITTHFNYLTKLSKTNNYINYKFEVEKVNDEIIKSYKISEGISKQYLALDMLEKNGYNSEMIQEARTIFQELVDANEQPKEPETEQEIEIESSLEQPKEPEQETETEPEQKETKEETK
jgi:DNA mismatch repair protein MutS